MLATLGERDAETAGSGSRRLDDAQRRAVRRQALGVAVRSLAVGIIVTAILWWFFVARMQVQDI